MRGLHYDPHLMEWLRLAGIVVVTLAALLALVAMVLMSNTPDGVPLILSGG
ncbi:MAG: hypothetical protein HY821_16510 [Acidobacteria bacterium]|nr:hypothetical protein [Acidobacteriota bacterium]